MQCRKNKASPWFLTGLVSFGPGPCGSGYGVYLNVQKYAQWITKKTGIKFTKPDEFQSSITTSSSTTTIQKDLTTNQEISSNKPEGATTQPQIVTEKPESSTTKTKILTTTNPSSSSMNTENVLPTKNTNNRGNDFASLGNCCKNFSFNFTASNHFSFPFQEFLTFTAVGEQRSSAFFMTILENLGSGRDKIIYTKF